MKHTTFENELRDIRRRAINELEHAFNASPIGKCEWPEPHNPIIYGGMRVLGVYKMDKNDAKTFGVSCRLFIRPMDEGDCVFVENIPIEDILKLTESIPETAEVKDVSGVYPVPVTWVDTDDIESCGFDSGELSQDKLKEIAEQMQDYYCDSSEFSINLYDACIACGLKEKED